MANSSDFSRKLQSIRLFPKHQGARNYILTGIASRCDWVLLSDKKEPKTWLIKQRQGLPKTVFISMREPFLALEFFYCNVLPRIRSHFVLITGSEDITLPAQLDRRWRRFIPREREMMESIRTDSRVLAWFAENLDTACAKMHPLPTGIVSGSCQSDIIPDCVLPPSHLARPTRVLCCHRVREGEQWQARREVTRYCKLDDSVLSTVITEEIKATDFICAQRQHAFVVCVEGGGLDPSPKAWTSMLNGAIPIIRRTPTTEAYNDLPVSFVEDWSEPFLDRNWLESERARLSSMFDDPAHWKKVERRLSLDFWWRRICCFLGKSRVQLDSELEQSRHLFVVGMHRSGTSLLTGLLAMCGAYAGADHELTGPNIYNPKGFWENNEFRKINDGLLQSGDYEWDCPLGFSVSDIDRSASDCFRNQASSLIQRFDGQPCALFKDPRLCLTLDFWKDLLSDILPIIVIRNPVEVAYSLFRRNRIPVPVGIALWEFYILSAARQSMDLNPVICNHNDLIYHPTREVGRLVEAVNNRCGPVLQKPDSESIETFVDTKLHRETAGEEVAGRHLVADQLEFWDIARRRRLDLLARRTLSMASQAALEGYQALGMQFSRVRHLESQNRGRQQA